MTILHERSNLGIPVLEHGQQLFPFHGFEANEHRLLILEPACEHEVEDVLQHIVDC